MVVKKPTRERRKISTLKEHPRQQELFGDLGDTELEAFAQDIRQHGLKHPIEILATGVVLCGHQRLRAVRKLGWTEIPVIIRSDLSEAAAEASGQDRPDRKLPQAPKE